jgi:hypothetical protein
MIAEIERGTINRSRLQERHVFVFDRDPRPAHGIALFPLKRNSYGRQIPRHELSFL